MSLLQNKQPGDAPSLPQAIFKSGLLVGSLDILAAFASAYLQYGMPPEQVLRYVASGVYGNEAFTGGNSMLSMGMLFHYTVAMAFTAFFYLLYPAFKWMAKNVILTGLIYGFFMWAVMSQLVLPLTHVTPGVFKLKQAVISILILVVAIGIPLSYRAQLFYAKRK
jgi:uncharacterized membrane protein YagU involved in acid resistance